MAIRKRIGNLIDTLGTKLNLPEFGLSERIAGGNTLNSLYGPAAPDSLAPSLQGDETDLTASDPFSDAVASLQSGASEGPQAMDIRIVGGIAYNVADPSQRSAWMQANNAAKMNEFEMSAASDEDRIRQAIDDANFSSKQQADEYADSLAKNESSRLNFLETIGNQRGDLNKRFGLSSTLQAGRYAANPLLQSSQGVAERVLGDERDAAQQEIAASQSRGEEEFGRAGSSLQRRADSIARAYAAQVENQRANLQRIADQRANLQNRSRSEAIETILPYSLDEGQSVDLSQFGAPAQAAQVQTTDLGKFGALNPSEVVGRGSASSPVVSNTSDLDYLKTDDDKEKEGEDKVLNFLKLGFSR